MDYKGLVVGFILQMVLSNHTEAQYWGLVEARNDQSFNGSFCVDALGNEYESAEFFSSITLGATTLTANGAYGFYVGKKGPTNEWLWAKHLDRNWSNDGWTMETSPNGVIWVIMSVGPNATYDGTPIGTGESSLAILGLSPSDGSLIQSISIPGASVFFGMRSTAFGDLVVWGRVDNVEGAYVQLPSNTVVTDPENQFLMMFTSSGEPLWDEVVSGDGYLRFFVGEDLDDGSILCVLGYPTTCEILGQTLTAPQVQVDESEYNTAWLRIDRDGNIIWSVNPTASTTAYLYPGPPIIDADGTIHALCLATGAVEFAGLAFTDATPTWMKVSSDGNGISVQPLDASGVRFGYMHLLSDGDLLVSGLCSAFETAQVGTFTLTDEFGSEVPIIARMSSDGAWEWVEALTLDGPTECYLMGANLDLDGAYRMYLFADGDISFDGETLLSTAGMLQSLGLVFTEGCMRVQLEELSAASCAEPTSGAITLSVEGAAQPVAIAWADGGNGLIRTGLEAGTYEATITDSEGCEVTKLVHVPGPSALGGIDATCMILPDQVFRPGLTTNTTVATFMAGCMPENVTLKILPDPLVELTDPLAFPDEQIGDTLVISMGQFSDEMSILTRDLTFITALSAQIGDSVCFEVSVGPFAGDIDPANDRHTVCFPIVNSYDPNDKRAIPSGDGPFGAIGADVDELSYLIRFQNTGNAEAFNIHIDDTLSTALDVETVQLINSSHPCSMDILNDRVLRFTFADINLPDSASNEADSHGHVLFKIRFNPLVTVGSAIENTAHIFFDNNAPIVTNTTLNTVEDLVGILDVERPAGAFFAWPNPATDRVNISVHAPSPSPLMITDPSGRVVQRVDDLDQAMGIDISGLPSGLFFIHCGDQVTTFLKTSR